MTDHSAQSSYAITIGRLLLALYFLLPGLAKFGAYELHIGMMERHGVPLAGPLLIIAGLANIIGAILLVTNRYVRFTSFGFVVYIIVINFFMHDFWNYSDIEGQHELQNFVKNLGILAGLLALAGYSPRRKLTLSGIKQSDKAMSKS
ncbi:DoxX family protein [Kordiimonas sp. SCSIO 12610]|uniref:DoxX family protein n=1 Tax=Kordiimonas sp. SCSIO 12610 TaxID=2829597 RepID=UPI002109F45B|nr:DoxX family protein [Kordiimonas sp. SCSIO 12610]UTW53984.1 DoxX family protein [Kordiimonas sp. SCSIO 12610]